jgi:LEA14-like dessication related protein
MEMTPKLRNGLIVGGLSVATIALIAYFSRQVKLLKDACYTISGGIVQSLTLTNVKMTLFFKIVNESDLTIQVSDMIFNIYVNNMFVTNIKKPEAQTIYSKSNTIIKLEFEFNPADLLRAGITNIQTIIYDKDKLIISIKGNFTAKTGIVRVKNYPIDEKITLKELLSPSSTAKKC